MLLLILITMYRSVFKVLDQVQGQGVPRIENGAYTLVREYFNSRDNTAIGSFRPFKYVFK
mgnify:CR=1 FL=1